MSSYVDRHRCVKMLKRQEEVSFIKFAVGILLSVSNTRFLFVFLLVCCLSGKGVCEFPGEPKGGFVVPTKFHYFVGEGISVVCKGNHQPLGPAFIYCTTQGKWSASLPSCSNTDFQDEDQQHDVVRVETLAKIPQQQSRSQSIQEPRYHASMNSRDTQKQEE